MQRFYTLSNWSNHIEHIGLGAAFQHMLGRQNVCFTFGVINNGVYPITTYTPTSLFNHRIVIWKDLVRQEYICNWDDVKYFLKKDVFQYHLGQVVINESAWNNTVDLFFRTNMNNTAFRHQKFRHKSPKDVPWQREGF